MKKHFAIILAAMLMVGAAGQAMAMISTPNLIRIVYQGGTSGTVEIGTDLGVAGSSLSVGTLGGGNFNSTMFGGAAFSDMNVAYIGLSSPIGTDLWFSATSLPTVNTLVFTSTRSAFNNVYTGAYAAGTTTAGVRSVVKSYYTQLDKAGAFGGIGSLNVFVTQGATNNLFGVEANLAALATTGGYVDQKLYNYNNTSKLVTDTGFTLRTLSDGSTLVMATATPIPPSVLLLGSGLLGMIGIRRKIA